MTQRGYTGPNAMLAEIERLRKALSNLLALCEDSYDRGPDGRFSPREEAAFREAEAIVNMLIRFEHAAPKVD